jgi:hypothetical protein
MRGLVVDNEEVVERERVRWRWEDTGRVGENALRLKYPFKLFYFSLRKQVERYKEFLA